MFCLNKDEFYFAPGQKIVTKDEYAKYTEANQVIQDAQRRAEQIIADAQVIYEEEKKRGFEEGMTEGNKKISEHMIEYVSKSVANLENFENDIIQVVMQALRKIVGDIDQDTLIMGIVHNALERVRDQKKVTLIVAPAQEQTVRDRLSEIMREFPTITFMQVERDNRIKTGGCMLVTEMGMVDATLEIQLEAIEKSLKRVIK